MPCAFTHADDAETVRVGQCGRRSTHAVVAHVDVEHRVGRVVHGDAQAVFERDIGIRFNGKERSDVEEYCISEGWVRVPASRTLDRKGQPLMIKLKGTVEAFYR